MISKLTFPATLAPKTFCPNCAASADQSHNCSHKGDWGEGDEVVTCNQCNTTYGHAVTVGYFIEECEGKP